MLLIRGTDQSGAVRSPTLNIQLDLEHTSDQAQRQILRKTSIAGNEYTASSQAILTAPTTNTRSHLREVK